MRGGLIPLASLKNAGRRTVKWRSNPSYLIPKGDNMHKSCIDFGKRMLKKNDVYGKHVLEVGSMDVNGSLRPIVEVMRPAIYIGVDIQKGRKVDMICSAYDLIEIFGYESFDVVISTEMLEHVKAWQKAISNMKNVLKHNGILLITTRSKGFPYHEYPSDYWRYEVSDMEKIFSDFTIEAIEKDTQEPGVFLKARKPMDFNEKDLSAYKLYAIEK
jgi:SAM-dependent methyltransferase